MDVAFVGLGAMGTPMAQNLADAGHLSCVYNRTRGKTEPFTEKGIDVAGSPKECAEGADAVVIMVTGDEAVKAVLAGPNGIAGGLAGGAVVIQMSTVSVGATMDAAQTVQSAGGRFVDAPVSGTIGPARQGALTVLAGGDDETLDEVEPILSVMGDPVKRCGKVGDGTKTKLFTNLLLGGQLQVFAEALVFGRKHGLSLDHMKDVISSSPVHAPLYDYKFPVVEDRDFEKQFPVDLLLKDLDLILEAGKEEGVFLPQTAATREAVSGTSAAGHGDEDMMAVIKLLERVAGLEK